MFGSHLHSLLLSQVFGLYFVIMSIIFMSRAEYYKDLISKIKTPGSGVVMTASLCLFIGLFLVLMHNIWDLKPRVVVTILCWLFVMKSVLWLASPERMLKMIKHIWKGRGHTVLCVVMLFLGMYLVARGFYLFLEVEAGGFAGIFPITR